MTEAKNAHVLRARRIGVFAQDEAIVFMRSNCFVCRSEGLSARSRVLLAANGREALATLYQVDAEWLAADEAGLSEAAWCALGVAEGDEVRARHAQTVQSFADVRRRLHGGRLVASALKQIIADIARGRYSEIQITAFIAAGSALPFDRAEMTELTRAMVEAGERLEWPSPMVIDKHCVGGLPGNRTTPIVVAILASLGLVIPKTSSRAITSPAGTADVMETLTTVDLDVSAMRRVVEAEGACLAWGGAVNLSPADDILIRIERALDIDTEGQLVASVLSKKIAAGASHVVFDLPVGPTAKVRTAETARTLAGHLTAVAAAFGLEARCLITDGTQPVGRGIGPALEARDVLAVLQNSSNAPDDLRTRAVALAGAALELAAMAAQGAGAAMASAALADGRAWRKFVAICEAQGGLKSPPSAALRRAWTAQRSGIVTRIDNRKLARVAKLTGAPDDKSAGLELAVALGAKVDAGQALLTLHSGAEGRLDYASEYAAANADLFEISG